MYQEDRCKLKFYLNETGNDVSSRENAIFTPQPLRAVGVLFSPMVSRWAGRRVAGKCLSGLYSEIVRCRKLILGRDIG